MFEFSKTLGNTVYTKRKKMKLTQAELAEMAGVTEQTICKIEHHGGQSATGCSCTDYPGTAQYPHGYFLSRIKLLRTSKTAVEHTACRLQQQANRGPYTNRQRCLRGVEWETNCRRKMKTEPASFIGKQALRFMRLAFRSQPF